MLWNKIPPEEDKHLREFVYIIMQINYFNEKINYCFNYESPNKNVHYLINPATQNMILLLDSNYVYMLWENQNLKYFH